MKKAVFFDIDGTLIDCLNDHHDLTDTVKEAIYELQKRGHYAFIATGRPYAFLSDAIKNFGFDGFILTNGAQVMINNEMIYQGTLDVEFVKNATSEFEKRDIQYMLQSDKYSYMKEEFSDYYAFFDRIGVSREYLIDNYQLEDVRTQKIELWCPNEEALEYCLDFAKNNPDYDYVHSISERIFEFYSKKNTKATGILKALDHLNIPIERSFAFGDGKNDIEMLSTVGCGIAMGNATDEIKSYAHQVTDSVLEDGVATGIHRYVLN